MCVRLPKPTSTEMLGERCREASVAARTADERVDGFPHC
jgi:hypothetical protein